MLDATLKTQLQGYLQNLRAPIELIATLDASDKSAELRALLAEIASLSDKVRLRPTGARQARPAAARIARCADRPRSRGRTAGDRPRRAIAL